MQIPKITKEALTTGTVVRNPVGNEKGYWVGCPGAYYDETDKAWYLTYRIRRPRGVQPDRGGEVRVAKSTDLKQWDDILAITKDKYDSASIERSAVFRGKDGLWRYFTSYVDPADGRWCTVVIKGEKIEDLKTADRKVIFTAQPLGLEGVKDPWIMEENGTYYMFLSIALPIPATGEGSHASLDIFNTGECKSATGLATSKDLDNWEWQGTVLAPGETGWDKYCRRINSVVKLGDKYYAFFDGSASHLENYEEKTAYAVSTDLRNWQSLSPDGPELTSPHASTSLRYIDAQKVNGTWYVFYEFAKADGSHDLRLITCDDAGLPFPKAS